MEAVMVRYGELFLKSEPVMRRFVDALRNNLHLALEEDSLPHQIRIFRGRILVHGDDPSAIAATAARVFGVVGASVCTVTESDPVEITVAAVSMAERGIRPGMTYAVRARRANVKGFSSQELAARVGAAIGERIPSARVDLDRPEYEIHVEAREFGGLVYDSQIPGPGGLPLGTQGKVLALVSDGIDSPVAAGLMMRRGCTVTLLHLHAGRWGDSGALDRVLSHAGTLSTWTPGIPLRLVTLSLEPFYDRLTESGEVRLRCVLCKRFMLRAACRVARAEGALAVVNGDNVGQVASQTLANLAVVDPAADLPVLRPLIGYDKGEIVNLAKLIGTFAAVKGGSGCRVVPRHPSTAASLEKVLAWEEGEDMEDILTAVLSSKTVYRAEKGKVREITPREGRSPGQSP